MAGSNFIVLWLWFPAPMCVLCVLSCSVMSNSLQPQVFQVPLSKAILQAKILEWVAMPSSRGSSPPRDQTQVSHMAGRFFTIWATREAQEYWSGLPIPSPRDLPYPGMELGSRALQADSLPAELPGKPSLLLPISYFLPWIFYPLSSNWY